MVDQIRFHSHSRIELRIGLAVQLGGEGVVAGLEELVHVVGDLLERTFEPACGGRFDRRGDGDDAASMKFDLHTASEPVPRPLQRVLDFIGEVF